MSAFLLTMSNVYDIIGLTELDSCWVELCTTNYLDIREMRRWRHVVQFRSELRKLATNFAVYSEIPSIFFLSWALHNQVFRYPGDAEMTSCCATVYLEYFRQFSDILKRGQIGVKSGSITKFSSSSWNFAQVLRRQNFAVNYSTPKFLVFFGQY